MEVGRSLPGGSRRSKAASASLRPSSRVCSNMDVSITIGSCSLRGVGKAQKVYHPRTSSLGFLMIKKHSVLVLITLVLAGVSVAQAPEYDFVIAGAHVVDGTGAPWFVGDIGIRGDRIAAIGDLHNASTTRRIEAAGLVVAPGFIDVQGQSEFNLLVDGRAAS